MKEIVDEIKRLEELACKTDSKKEDFEYRQQIRGLKRKLEEDLDNKLKNFPEFVPVTITLKKTIEFDTLNFKEWIREWIEDDMYDSNLVDEFKDYFKEEFYIDDYVGTDDYEYKFGI